MASTRPEIDLDLPGYEILREIGRGGVSTVYLARHRLLDREVAIKVMSPVLAVEEGFNKRFLREGQTIAQFKHPGIVTVYDVAVVNHRPFIAMEYLPGGSLKDMMTGAIPPQRALGLLRSIADSLGYAHGRGVFHRDVKPENILFRENGDPVLTDFGIAKSDSQETALTSMGVVVGTPRYISPEQAQGHESDARSDIYALGVILYEMLIGKPPYDVKGNMSLLYAHINDPIPRLPEDLHAYQELIDELLAKSPDQRISDCGALLDRLKDLEGAGDGKRARRARAAGGRRFRRGWPALAAAALVVPALALLLWTEGHRLSITGPEDKEEFRSMVSRLVASNRDAAAEPSPPAHGASAATTPKPRTNDAGPSAGGEAPADEAVDDDAAEEVVDARALFEEAQVQFHGRRSIERDVAEAVRLYERAASRGHALSQYYLGVAYGNGNGVERDEAEAVRWLSRASEADVQGAKYNLILARIFGPENNAREAAKLALELAEQNYAPVYRILGWMYNTGTGVDSSFSQSVKWNVKTMVGDVTGKNGPPGRVVHHWERWLEAELDKIRAAEPPRATPVVK